jgi:hypothetical protein
MMREANHETHLARRAWATEPAFYVKSWLDRGPRGPDFMVLLARGALSR